jgi:integrase
MPPGAEEILRSRIGHHPEFVFTYVAKKRRAGVPLKGPRMPVTKMGLRSYWYSLKERLTISGLWWHELRRSLATKLLKMTGNPAPVQGARDHSNPRTSLRDA